ncbi:immunoglobulin domain-containing protein [Nibricoccus aquaticus]|uniref:immunoglobulin domain-containing protein n=1 Tax=Nibricoccus aquaticus TaxID=2576891 RepID=UPI002481DDFC|nr:immunoglobulin domain-containing protein [Nibricoccus aquaticus]
MAATGTGTLTYQWQKDGFALTGATTTTYSITATTLSQSGNYAVVVTDTSGSTTSSAAILTVNPDPTITTQPASRVVIGGATVHFSVVASGTGTLTYQWKKNGAEIAGATAVNYSVFNASASDAADYTVVVTNTVGSDTSAVVTTATSNIATLVVNPLPVIATQPASVFVDAGGSATFSVGATGTGSLSYQWQKESANIAGATAASLTIGSAQAGNAGSYRVIVTDSIGSTTSSTVSLMVGSASALPVADGFAVAATGGGSATPITVTTAADFRTQAESTAPAVIRVSGTLNLGATKVAVKSNKTIQGVDANATLIGNLEMASGVNSVIICGLNITNPNAGGDGISVVGATNVYITHCTFFDCADGLIDITAGADNVTVSWCEFYYTAAQTTHRYAMTVGAATGETKALRVTLHHNRWFDGVDQSMPVTTWGRVHMYNNSLELTTTTANTAATKVQTSAQLLSERNQYIGLRDPLVKSDTGLIRAINNLYTNTTLSTGATAEAGTDTVFTPTYSYEMHSTDAMTVLQSAAGNTAGAASTSPTTASVTAASTATTLTAGNAFTLSATPTGFTASEATAYQWRLNNVAIPGGDKSTFVVNSAVTGHSGIYTVLVLKPSGGVVSTPVTITVNAAETPTAPAVTTDDGGGSPSAWFLGALAFVCGARAITRRRTS